MRGNFHNPQASIELFSRRRRPLTRPGPSLPPRQLDIPTATIVGVRDAQPAENRKRRRPQQERTPRIPHPKHRRGVAKDETKGPPVTDVSSQAYGGSHVAQSSLLTTTRRKTSANPTAQDTKPSSIGNFDNFSVELQHRGVSSVATLLNTGYNSYCKETLLALSAAKRLGLEMIPSQPGNSFPLWTISGYTQTRTFVRVHVRVPGFSAVLGDCNFAVVPDDVLGQIDILVGSKQMKRLVKDCGISRETLNLVDRNVIHQRTASPLDLSNSRAASETPLLHPRNLELTRKQSTFLQPGYQQPTNSLTSYKPSYFESCSSKSGVPQQSTPESSISFAQQSLTNHAWKHTLHEPTMFGVEESDSLLDHTAPGFNVDDFDVNFPFALAFSDDNASGPLTSLLYPPVAQSQMGYLDMLGSSTDHAFEMTTTPHGQTPSINLEKSKTPVYPHDSRHIYTRPTSEAPATLQKHRVQQSVLQQPLEELTYSLFTDSSSNDIVKPHSYE